MPNHCENELTFFADTEERLEQLVEQLKGVEPGYFDKKKGQRYADQETELSFHKLIPVPDEVLDQEYSDAGYNWQRENWGVKWGAYDICREDIQENEVGNFSLSYSFSTAWRDPSGIIRVLPELFPDVSFDWCYSEPGMMFFGAHRYEPGQEGICELYYDTLLHSNIYEILAAMKEDEAPNDLIESVEGLIEMLEEEEYYE